MGPLPGFQLRELTLQEAEKFSFLLDVNFDLKEGSHFLDDFPIWSLKLQLLRREKLQLGIFLGEELIACGNAIMVEMFIKKIPRKLTLVGAISVLKSYRGKGLAKKITLELLNWAKGKESLAALLWSSQGMLYQGLGFREFGNQFRYPLRGMFLDPQSYDPSESPGYQIIGNESWRPELLGSLMSHRHGGLMLCHEDNSWLTQHKNVKWFWVQKYESVIAYAAYGRGIDMAGVIHEWGGEKQYLTQIFQLILNCEPQAWILGNSFLFEKLGISASVLLAEAICEPLAWAFVFDQDIAKVEKDLWIWGLDAV